MNTKRRLCSALLLAVFVLTCCIKMPVVSASAADNVEINETNFPDDGFRTMISQQYDKDKDGKLSAAEIAGVTNMSFRRFLPGLSSLENTIGISFFKNLKMVNVQSDFSNNINLDLRGCTSLETVMVNNSSVNEFNLSGCSSLKTVIVHDTSLNSINLSGCSSLSSLRFDRTKLKDLDISTNGNLTALVCNYADLSALDVSNNTNLAILDCTHNKLSELNVDNNTNLVTLYCGGNELTELNLSNNTKLTHLNCTKNSIFNLDLSNNPALKNLYCDSNNLEIINLSNCKNLEFLSCAHNHLDYSDIDFTVFKELRSLNIRENANFYNIDLSQNTLLEELDCCCNMVSKLDISHNPKLVYVDCSQNSIDSLDISKQKELVKLICYSNQLDQLDVSKNLWLDYLDCTDNAIELLNVENNSKLVELYCSRNPISSLNVSKNLLLNKLRCQENELTKLDVSKNELLEELNIGCTDINTLDLSNSRYLRSINIDATRIKNLDVTNTLLDGSNVTSIYPDITVIDNYVPVPIDANYFPDDKFREEVDIFIDYDRDGSLSKTEIVNYGEHLSITSAGQFPESLKGLEYIPGCRTLSIVGPVSELDLSKNRILKGLTVSSNITNLNLSDAPLLEVIGYSGFSIKSLDITNCSRLHGIANTDTMSTKNNIDRLDFSGNVLLRKMLRSNNWSLTPGFTTSYDEYRPNWNIGSYYINIDGSMSSIDCDIVLADKSDNIEIASQPKSVNIPENEIASFGVSAKGTGLSYLWQYYPANGGGIWTDWTSKNTANISVAYSPERDGMYLRCRITDQNGEEVVTTPVKLSYIKENSLRVTQQPSNAKVKENESASFSVKADGVGLKYLWQYKEKGKTSWTDWTTKTTADISVAYAAYRNGMSLRCRITDAEENIVFSNEAVLTYESSGSGIVITVQPKDTAVDANALANFSVKATGTGLSYLWQYKEKGKTTWIDWTSKKTAEISVAYASYRDGMSFRCVITDASGKMATSNAATLTYNSSLAITTQPANTAANSGELAYFEVKATGKGLKYLWQYKAAGSSTWTDWTSKTTAKISVAYASYRDGMSFRCVVTDASGKKVTSNAATLTYNVPLAITTQPANTAVNSGELAYFEVKASGKGLKYLWQYKAAGSSTWTDWTSKTTAKISVAYASYRDGMSFRCVVTDASGKKVTSNAATLNYNIPLAITTQPANTAVNSGELAYFEVKASGKGLKYLWQYKAVGSSTWTDWTSKTSAKISVAYASYRDGMSFRCVVTDANGKKVTSNAAVLTYTVALAITQQPVSVTVDKNTVASFSVKATGNGLKYQWQYKNVGDADWTTWGSKTKADITVAYAVYRGGMGLRCVITDASGQTVTTNVVTLNYN